MIVVTAATGHYGSKVVEGLLRKLSAPQVGVSVRDPKKALGLAAKGIRVRKGDFTDPSTLATSFEGAEQVLIVSVNVLGEEALRQHGNAIRAAKDAGVKRVLYTSHQAASPNSKVSFARDHAATEALLEASGVPFVSLRNGFYAESSLSQLGGIQETGKLALPEDGPVSWTARDDLAEAAVAALTNTSLFDGITAPLTASETYTFADVALLASDVLGREIVREVISEGDYRRNALQRGFPEPMVGMLLSMFEAIRDREFDIVDPTLERVLGRRPTNIRNVIAPFLSVHKERGGRQAAH